MKRISEKDLELKIQLINEKLRTPLKTYLEIDGKFTAQIDNYHLSMSGGAYALEKIACKNGSVNAVLYGATKKELFLQLESFLLGLETEPVKRKMLEVKQTGHFSFNGEAVYKASIGPYKYCKIMEDIIYNIKGVPSKKDVWCWCSKDGEANQHIDLDFYDIKEV